MNTVSSVSLDDYRQQRYMILSQPANHAHRGASWLRFTYRRMTRRCTRRAVLMLGILPVALVAASCGSVRHQSTSTGAPASASQPVRIDSVAMPDRSTLLVTTNTGDVYYSTNGGSTWTTRTPSGWHGPPSARPPEGEPAGTITSSSAWIAHVLPGGVVSVGHTTDGGLTWHTSVLPKSYPNGLGPVGVSFVGADTGWASVNEPTGPALALTDVFHTSDGGSLWNLESTINGAAGPIEFVTAQVGYAGDTPAANRLYETTSAGQTWTPAPLPTPVGVQAEQIPAPGLPIFTSQANGFLYVLFEAVQGRGPLLPYMDETSNGGASWTQVSLPSTNRGKLPDAWSVVSPTDWFLAGSNTILHTTDGGKHWTEGKSNMSLGVPVVLKFVTDSVGIALINVSTCAGTSQPVTNPCTSTDELVKTTDSGKTWAVLHVPT